MTTINIYVLLLEHEKYYIGRTSNIDSRVSSHIEGTGSEWTKLHKPLTTVETIQNADLFDEDKYTLKYMAKYGIENVRGGSYSQVILPIDVIRNIERQIRNAQDRCFLCGESGHFVKNCPNEEKHVLLQKQNEKKSSVFGFFSFCYQEITNLFKDITSSNNMSATNKFMIVNKLTHMCIESVENSHDVIVAIPTKAEHQQWTFNNGILCNVLTKMCLENGGGTSKGNIVKAYENDDSLNKKWIKDGDCFINALTNNCIENGGGCSGGNIVKAYGNDNAMNKKWDCVVITEQRPVIRSGVLCSRCGRNNHTVEKCFAKFHLNGTPLL
jgi:GAG-polyprotein viral zinc-finger/Ricin-type beta-trefoil lectin domain/Zinc knuckle